MAMKVTLLILELHKTKLKCLRLKQNVENDLFH